MYTSGMEKFRFGRSEFLLSLGMMGLLFVAGCSLPGTQPSAGDMDKAEPSPSPSIQVLGPDDDLDAQPSPIPETPETEATSKEEEKEERGFHARIVRRKVPDGSLTLIRVTVDSSEAREILDSDPSLLVGDFEGVSLPFYPVGESDSGVFEAVLGIPHDHKPGPAKVTISLGDGDERTMMTVRFRVVDARFRSEKLHVDGGLVNPSEKDLSRIKKEQAEVRQIYEHVTRVKYWTRHFIRPMKSAITSRFGTRRIFNGEVRSYHGGLDFRAKVGTPIYSAAPGVVVLAKSLFFTGNTVMIDHGYGVITLYAHMSKLSVKKGDKVGYRTLLGLSGKTGRVSGPHLHWQAVVHNVKVNPLELTRFLR